MKKVITLILVISICLTSIITTYATTPNSIAYNENELYEISRLLYDTYNFNIFELSKYNLSDLRLASPINSYTYLDGELIVSPNKYIPVYCGNNICGTVISFTTPDNETNYTYSESYSSELNSFINENDSLAIVGVEDGTMAISADNYTVLSGTATNSEIIALVQNRENIVLKEVIQYYDFELNTNRTRNTNISTFSDDDDNNSSIVLNVPPMRQSSNYNCWLACAASVGNYVTGNKYTMNQVENKMRMINQNFKLYDAATVLEVKTVLQSVFSVSSTAYASPATLSVIISNISHNKPIVGLFFPPTSDPDAIGHMVVLCGYSSSTNHLTLVYMDPSNATYRTSRITSSIYIIVDNLTYSFVNHLRLT